MTTLFSADGWHLEGCPAVGPALAWGGGGGLYVWYTEAGTPGVYAAPWTPERGRTGVRRSLTDGLLDASHPRAAAFGAATLIAVEARPRADTASRVLAVRALDESGALTPWTLLGAEVENGWIATAGAAVALACWSERREGASRRSSRGGRLGGRAMRRRPAIAAFAATMLACRDSFPPRSSHRPKGSS